MGISREVDSAEGHIPEQTGLGSLVQAEQPQVLDHRPGSNLGPARDLPGHLQPDLHYLQGVREHHLGSTSLGEEDTNKFDGSKVDKVYQICALRVADWILADNDMQALTCSMPPEWQMLKAE